MILTIPTLSEVWSRIAPKKAAVSEANSPQPAPQGEPMATAPVTPVPHLSFFARIWAFVKKEFTHPPAWAITILSTVKFTIPLVESLDLIIAPEAAAEVNPILDRIKTGLAALSVTVSDAGSSPTAASILASLQSNLASLEATAGVKDAATQAKIAAIIALIKAEVDAMASSVPTSAPAAS